MTNMDKTKLLKLELLIWGFWKEQVNGYTYGFMPDAMKKGNNLLPDLLIKSPDKLILAVEKYSVSIEGSKNIVEFCDKRYVLQQMLETHNQILLILEAEDGTQITFESVTIQQPDITVQMN